MRVHLLKATTVVAFADSHRNVKGHVKRWLEKLKFADWQTPQDMTHSCTCNLIGDNRVVFDIGGNGRNACRFICEFKLGEKEFHLFVVWMGTHEEYNHLTPQQKETIDMKY